MMVGFPLCQRERFSTEIIDIKLKAGIFNGPQIQEVICDQIFEFTAC